MIKSTTCLIFIFFSIALIGCTKDIVPNPVTANSDLGAQTVIYDQNFNTAYPNWPTGWSASPATGGWKMDTSTANNSATGAGEGTYTGASGGAMVEVANSTGSGGTYTMTTGSVSTVGYTNITVIWGARNSKNFSVDGSAINSFAWSGDGGTTWNTINYTQNAANSDWGLVDGGVRIMLPATAAGTTLSFQWIATTVATPSGDYRIDDFQVYGTANK